MMYPKLFSEFARTYITYVFPSILKHNEHFQVSLNYLQIANWDIWLIDWQIFWILSFYFVPSWKKLRDFQAKYALPCSIHSQKQSAKGLVTFISYFSFSQLSLLLQLNLTTSFSPWKNFPIEFPCENRKEWGEMMQRQTRDWEQGILKVKALNVESIIADLCHFITLCVS